MCALGGVDYLETVSPTLPRVDCPCWLALLSSRILPSWNRFIPLDVVYVVYVEDAFLDLSGGQIARSAAAAITACSRGRVHGARKSAKHAV